MGGRPEDSRYPKQEVRLSPVERAILFEVNELGGVAHVLSPHQNFAFYADRLIRHGLLEEGVDDRGAAWMLTWRGKMVVDPV